MGEDEYGKELGEFDYGKSFGEVNRHGQRAHREQGWLKTPALLCARVRRAGNCGVVGMETM